MDSAMGITSALNTGSQGVQKGFATLERAGNNLFPDRLESNIVKGITDLIQGRNQVKASASFVRVLAGTLGSLLDLSA